MAARFPWFLLVGLLVAVPALAAPGPARPPNVVILLADDQGWGDLGVHGNRMVATPRIDSLAQDGAAFGAFYVCAVCAPTRAEFLTGRYHLRGGVRGVSTGQERLDLGERTIAQHLQAAGYATGAFGKWHNGSQWPYHPLARGFDEYYGFTSGHWGEYFDPPLEHNGKPVRGRGYITDDLTTQAIDFIGRHRDRPFLCYVPYNVPHSPFAVPAADWERWRERPISQPGTLGEKEDPDVTRCVLAMTENLDRNVGRILDRLDELGLRDNTIVVYFSDNGPATPRWNGGMKGRKGSVEEGGLRSPLFIRWPGRIAAGARVPQVAGAIDLLPTLASLAGLPAAGARPLDGVDLSPLLLGGTTTWPDRPLFSYWAGRVSVRTQQYRLDPTGALFDLAADPGQTRDVASLQPVVARQLRDAVTAWRAELGAPTARPGRQAGSEARPFTVGYREFPWTPLPARDGVPHGGVRRSATAPNSSYFVNWTSRDDRLTWAVDVHTAGTYEVVLHYTVPAADAGATVELSLGGRTLSGKIAPGWDPPLYANQDTLPRPPAESRMKEFRPLALGRITLESGRGELSLRATEIPGRTVMDLRGLSLTLVP